MAETLGSLCDKLTIVKLKQWHTDDRIAAESLAHQERQLEAEIGEFIAGAISGSVPEERLTFSANKVYRKEGNLVPEAAGSIGELMAQLAQTNCALWHVQEKVYEFEKVPAGEKDAVVKKLALLNLERTRCIDQLDVVFRSAVQARSRPTQTP
jgi:hypothetical protein